MRLALLTLFLFPPLAIGASAPEVKVGTRSCEIAYAGLSNHHKKILAASAGAHVVAIGALAAVQTIAKPKEEAPKPLEKSAVEKFFSVTELPASRLLTREEIVKRAQEALLSEKKDRGMGADLGETLIQSEIGSKPPPDLKLLAKTLRQFKKDQVVLHRISNEYGSKQLEKIEKAVAYLHRNYFRHYCRDRGNLTSFFGKEQCGNCQSNTKLILAHLHDAGISPPEGYTYGAQLYGDHIAPVLIEKKTNRVLDLVSNQEQATPQAPVYRRSILFHAMLTNMKEKPAAEPSDLLLAAADPAALSGPVSDTGKIDSNTTFVGGAGSYGHGKPVPDSVDMPRGGLSGEMLGREKAATGFRNVMDYTKAKIEVSRGDGNPYDLTIDPSENKISVSPEIAKLCEAELNPVNQASYHVCQDKRAHQRIDQMLAKPAGQMLARFAQHPEKAASYSEKDLLAMADLLDEMNRSIGDAYTYNITFHTLLTPHEGLDKIYDMIRNLDEKLENDPTTFLQFLDSLPQEKRMPVGRLLSLRSFKDVYSFVKESSTEANYYDHAGYNKLRELLYNDDEMFVFRPKTKLGPKDMVLYLDGDMKSGYVGHMHQPEGHEDTFTAPKEKDKSPDGKTGNSAIGGGIDQEVETKLRLSPATVAALVPFLPTFAENADQSNTFPKGRAGAAKYFTPGVVQAFMDSKPSDKNFGIFEDMAKIYFGGLDVRDYDDEKVRFFQLFGQEKFFYPFYADLDDKTNVEYSGGGFGGPYPEFLAKAILAGEKKVMDSWEKQEGIKREFSLRAYDEPVIREGDIPGPEDAEPTESVEAPPAVKQDQ